MLIYLKNCEMYLNRLNTIKWRLEWPKRKKWCFTGQMPAMFDFHLNCMALKESYVPSYWVVGLQADIYAWVNMLFTLCASATCARSSYTVQNARTTADAITKCFWRDNSCSCIHHLLADDIRMEQIFIICDSCLLKPKRWQIVSDNYDVSQGYLTILNIVFKCESPLAPTLSR